MTRSITLAIEDFVFARRGSILVAFTLLSVLMVYSASQLRIDAGFEKRLPLEHEFMDTFLEYQEEFGGANRILIALRAKDGDIFTRAFFEKLRAVTDEVFFLPGVDRSRVRSIFTPNVRFIEIVEDGFTGGNVVPADFRPTREGLERVRENVLKSGQVGRLVANDFSAAMVSAELLEHDPNTGERLDYIEVARQLESRIRERHQSDAVDIHIIGFAKVVGDIAEGAAGVIGFFGLALVITALIVFFYSRSLRMTTLALLCSLVAVIWQLGLLNALGFGLDPMSMLVPFLVFAIGVSHGVQMINGVRTAIFEGCEAREASRSSFHRLLIPGSVALVSDSIGFLTILLIKIPIIQELAIAASLGVAVIILTNLLLLPILLSYMPVHGAYREQLFALAERREPIWRFLAKATDLRVASAIAFASLALFGWGLWQSRKLAIGDLHAGVPELRADSRYNRDTAVIKDKFSIGVDVLSVIVEAPPDSCIDHSVVATIDAFDWHMQNVPGIHSSISLPQVMKTVNAGWNEGNLKWRVLSRNPHVLVRSVTPIETSTGLLNADCSVMPVILFTTDHKAETIERLTDEVRAFQASYNGGPLSFRLATGNVGVMAATNEVVEAAQRPILLWVYAAIFALCFLTFRSWRSTLCIVLPLGLVSVLAYALMSLLEIGLKVSTLPVAALGVGIGVDYGIYIFSRLKLYLEEGQPLDQAYLQTLRETGSAVLFTGGTLAIGVSTWLFSALKFQADMGFLLTFMFLVNMLGAVLVLPALAAILGRIGSGAAAASVSRDPT